MSEKQIRNRLDRLFEAIDLEASIVEEPRERGFEAEPTNGGTITIVADRPELPQLGGQLPAVPVSTVQSHSRSELANELSLDFLGTDQNWNRLQIVDEDPERTWSESDQMLVSQVVDQLTLALQNANLFQQTQRQTSELAVLNEMGREIATQYDVEQIAETVYRYTSKLMDTRNFFVALTDLKEDEISFPVLYDEGKRLPLTGRKVGRGLTDWVIRNKQPLLLNGDISQQTAELGLEVMTIGNDEPTLSWLGVPLLIGARVLGALVVQSTTTASLYQDRQRDLLLAIAGQAAISLQNAILFQQTQRQNEYLSTAANVARLVSSTLDLPTLFNRTVDLVRSSFEFYHAAIFTLDESGQNAVLREATGNAGEEMKRRGHSLPVGSKSIIGQTTALGQTTVVNDTATDAVFRPNPLLPDTRAEAGLPLRIGLRVIGALDIQATEPGAFKHEDIAALEILADQVAVAIENARSYDLTQKALEELRELDQIKSQFLANMSHELRTPLNSIIGFSRVILKGIDGSINDQQKQDLSAIYNSGQHLLGLINDILDLAKIEAGKMELGFEEVSVADTIHGVMSTAVGLVRDKPIQLRDEIDPSLPTIRADPMRLRQILLNLLSNAAKFTEQGEVVVKAEAQRSPEGIEQVLISVTDTGPGIAPADQEKLFKAFSQVDSSPTRKTGGTGLGLSICQHLVGLHEGQIGIRSTVGRGSTFYFTIPVFRQEPESGLSDAQHLVLCIDDDAQVIKLFERYLIPEGYQVEALTVPERACQVVRKLKPFAITLDIMMPGYDGWQVISDLKSDPETRDIPIIICSIVEEEERGFKLGAADYLRKPILEEELVRALQRLGEEGSGTEVLVIDDDPQDLKLMERILCERSGLRPILAHGGQQGWDMLLAHRPEAIILDLFMPDLDGFAILERLRTTPSLQDIPVIVLSGFDLTPQQRSQLDNLGKRMLQKATLSEDELFASLERELKQLEVKAG